VAQGAQDNAELRYSDHSINWQQMALPLDWGPWNYGIRTMEVGNNSTLVAPTGKKK
jgi:hypothetical protein